MSICLFVCLFVYMYVRLSFLIFLWIFFYFFFGICCCCICISNWLLRPLHTVISKSWSYYELQSVLRFFLLRLHAGLFVYNARVGGRAMMMPMVRGEDVYILERSIRSRQHQDRRQLQAGTWNMSTKNYLFTEPPNFFWFFFILLLC